MGRASENAAGRSARSWHAVLKRTVREFREDNLTDWAAALTYYGVMSLFPMVLVLVALLGLVGQYLERGRELDAGLPAETDLQLPPRVAASS
jgi:uncharacterized BrkB/YihY/UPF0761 family membrane protein